MVEFLIVSGVAFLTFATFLGVMALKAHRRSVSPSAHGGCGRETCHCRHPMATDARDRPAAAVLGTVNNEKGGAGERCPDCPGH